MRILILSLFLLSACVNYTTSAYIYKGMPQNEVLHYWGKPCRSCVGTRTTSMGEIWQYQSYGGRSFGHKNSFIYFDRSGRVEHWSIQK